MMDRALSRGLPTLLVSFAATAILMWPARAVEFETIRSNMNNMTSVEWDDYTESLSFGVPGGWTEWHA